MSRGLKQGIQCRPFDGVARDRESRFSIWDCRGPGNGCSKLSARSTIAVGIWKTEEPRLHPNVEPLPSHLSRHPPSNLAPFPSAGAFIASPSAIGDTPAPSYARYREGELKQGMRRSLTKDALDAQDAPHNQDVCLALCLKLFDWSLDISFISFSDITGLVRISRIGTRCVSQMVDPLRRAELERREPSASPISITDFSDDQPEGPSKKTKTRRRQARRQEM